MAFKNIEFAADIKACEIKLFLEKFDFAYSTKGTPNCKEIHFGKTLRLKDFSGKPVPKKRAVNFKGKQYRFNTSTENCFKNDFEDNAHFRALWLACFKSLQRVTGAKNHEFANLQCNVTEDATLSPHRDDCSNKLRTFLPAALTIVIPLSLS